MSYDDDEEEPSKVLFQNHQWAVTSLGVEGLGEHAYYGFNKERLLETTDYGSGELYDWPVHMAEKTWVDIEAFIQVFEKALDLHGYRKGVDQVRLEQSLARARKEARRTARGF